MTENIKKREEIPEKYKWDLRDLYETAEDWEKDAEKAAAIPAELTAFEGRLGESGEMLLSWFRKEDEVSVFLEKLLGYASLTADQDLGNGENQARRGRAVNLYVQIASAASFADPEIMQIPDETLARFYRETEGLSLYRLAIDRIRRKKEHTLSPGEEHLLAAAGEMAQAPSTIGSVFRNADLTFPPVKDGEGKEHELTQGTYTMIMAKDDRVLRKNTFETFYQTWSAHSGLSAAILDAQVKQQTFYARQRKYGSNLEAALTPNEVPQEVYFNLIDTVHSHMKSMYRYMDLRKKMLGVDELHMYDLYNSVVPDADEKISFEQAKEAVFEAVAPLGEDYAKIVREAYENRWIDVYENVGKRGGAYSSGGARPHPYILLNHKDNLNSQFTLVHETGHTVHSYLSMKNQPVVYSDYVIFVAEVASTCNEVLMMRNLLGKTEDRKKRAYLLNYFLEQFRTTLYRQTMFAEFELKINEIVEKGGTLTADELNRIYYDLNVLYYGKDMVVDPLIQEEWARIPHFFYNFYVYQYATGFAAAIALADRILTGGKEAAEDYLKFLSSGSSTDPISLLKIAGVDMSSPEPIIRALDEFDRMITEMEALGQD
jgi:oligoendopeptidase F